jgi:integrase
MTTRKAPAKIRGVYEREPGSGVWWICYKQGTVRKREKAGSRGNAINLYRQRKSELLAGKKLPPNLRTKGITFADIAKEAVEWYVGHKKKDLRNVTGRMQFLVAEFGEQSADKITTGQIDSWISSHKEWSPATGNRYKALMSKTFKLALASRKVTTNPARLVEQRSESSGHVRYLLDDEEAALRKVMKRRYQCHIPSLDVAIYTGMRKTEQFSLTWDCVDLKDKEIHLDKTKNGSSRTIPIHPECAKAFETLATESHKQTDRVFKSSRGQPLNNPRKWFETAIADAKIDGLRWHDLRHTFCSRLAMADVPIRTIADLAGHKTISMAMRYSHLSKSHKQSSIEKLGPIV